MSIQPTSKSANRQISAVKGKYRAKVLAHIRDCGTAGCTDFEGERATSMLSQSYTPRRRELAQIGAVVDSGMRRRTQSGRSAIVWVSAVLIPATTTTAATAATQKGGLFGA